LFEIVAAGVGAGLGACVGHVLVEVGEQLVLAGSLSRSEQVRHRPGVRDVELPVEIVLDLVEELPHCFHV